MWRQYSLSITPYDAATMMVHRARAWRDVSCTVSQLFPAAATHPAPAPTASDPLRPVQGITVDRHWRDMRFCIWNDA